MGQKPTRDGCPANKRNYLFNMATEIKLEKFHGPLDLLLQLIDREEMNITEVSLSEVTEQFVEYLEKIGEDSSEELADFLVVATRLVYLKSRVLLPYLNPEEDDGPSLADQLKMYQQYVEASKKIQMFWEQNRVAYGRMEPPIKVNEFVLPANAGTSDLLVTFERLLARLKPINPLPKIAMDRGVTVKEKVKNILDVLKSNKAISFNALVNSAENRTDVIVSFLALLELMRDLKITIEQTGSFADMQIKSV